MLKSVFFLLRHGKEFVRIAIFVSMFRHFRKPLTFMNSVACHHNNNEKYRNTIADKSL